MQENDDHDNNNSNNNSALALDIDSKTKEELLKGKEKEREGEEEKEGAKDYSQEGDEEDDVPFIMLPPSPPPCDPDEYILVCASPIKNSGGGDNDGEPANIAEGNAGNNNEWVDLSQEDFSDFTAQQSRVKELVLLLISIKEAEQRLLQQQQVVEENNKKKESSKSLPAAPRSGKDVINELAQMLASSSAAFKREFSLLFTFGVQDQPQTLSLSPYRLDIAVSPVANTLYYFLKRANVECDALSIRNCIILLQVTCGKHGTLEASGFIILSPALSLVLSSLSWATERLGDTEVIDMDMVSVIQEACLLLASLSCRVCEICLEHSGNKEFVCDNEQVRSHIAEQRHELLSTGMVNIVHKCIKTFISVIKFGGIVSESNDFDNLHRYSLSGALTRALTSMANIAHSSVACLGDDGNPLVASAVKIISICVTCSTASADSTEVRQCCDVASECLRLLRILLYNNLNNWQARLFPSFDLCARANVAIKCGLVTEAVRILSCKQWQIEALRSAASCICYVVILMGRQLHNEAIVQFHAAGGIPIVLSLLKAPEFGMKDSVLASELIAVLGLCLNGVTIRSEISRSELCDLLETLRVVHNKDQRVTAHVQMALQRCQAPSCSIM